MQKEKVIQTSDREYQIIEGRELNGYVYMFYSKDKRGKVVCDTLDDAVTSIVNDMHQNNESIYNRRWGHSDRFSKPYVVKVKGGYNVIVSTFDGKIRKRHIDVFKPKAHKTHATYTLDSCNTIYKYNAEKEVF